MLSMRLMARLDGLDVGVVGADVGVNQPGDRQPESHGFPFGVVGDVMDGKKLIRLFIGHGSRTGCSHSAHDHGEHHDRDDGHRYVDNRRGDEISSPAGGQRQVFVFGFRDVVVLSHEKRGP